MDSSYSEFEDQYRQMTLREQLQVWSEKSRNAQDGEGRAWIAAQYLSREDSQKFAQRRDEILDMRTMVDFRLKGLGNELDALRGRYKAALTSRLNQTERVRTIFRLRAATENYSQTEAEPPVALLELLRDLRESQSPLSPHAGFDEVENRLRPLWLDLRAIRLVTSKLAEAIGALTVLRDSAEAELDQAEDLLRFLHDRLQRDEQGWDLPEPDTEDVMETTELLMGKNVMERRRAR